MPDIGTRQGVPSPIDLEEHETRLALLQRAKAGDHDAIQALADRYHVRIGGMIPRATPWDTVKRGATVRDATMVACEVCQALVKRQGLGVHKAKAHGISGATKGGPPTGSAPKVQPSAAKSNGHGCESCLFRGLERAVDHELVRSAVLAGMSMDAACSFVRQAKAAMVT